MALSDILGAAAKNDSARQLFIWGVLYGLLSSVFEPITTEITQEMWEVAVEANLHRALSPDELATMVVRGWMTQSAAEAEAAKAGVAQNDFANMVNNRRNPISPEEAAVAFRRKIIPEDAAPGTPSFLNAIQEGNLGNQWAPVIEALAQQEPSPADILQAVLEGQVPAGIDPRVLYQAVGGKLTNPNLNIDWFDLMFNTRGQAPTPMEALTMLNRGIIPLEGTGPGVVSYHQAFLEGPWRNKWLAPFLGLREYFPPPRTITAMLKQGALTTAQAHDLLIKQGLSETLAQAYIIGATTTKTTKPKQLTESEIHQLVTDKLITVDQAVSFFELLGYPAAEAQVLASTAQASETIADLRSVTSRIETIYLAHKITRADALSMLSRAGLDPARAGQKVDGWDLIRESNIRVLTPAQITAAYHYGVKDQAWAMEHLQQEGYTAHDAWVLLSNAAHGPIPGEPPDVAGFVP